MFEDNKELSHYYKELAALYNEAVFLLKEASIEVDSQDLGGRIHKYLDQIELKKKSA